VQPAAIQQVRELTRTRKQLVREVALHPCASRRRSRTPTSIQRFDGATKLLRVPVHPPVQQLSGRRGGRRRALASADPRWPRCSRL
jgi:hypothetical protein